jgi:hypothetical protein
MRNRFSSCLLSLLLLSDLSSGVQSSNALQMELSVAFTISIRLRVQSSFKLFLTIFPPIPYLGQRFATVQIIRLVQYFCHVSEMIWKVRSRPARVNAMQPWLTSR